VKPYKEGERQNKEAPPKSLGRETPLRVDPQKKSRPINKKDKRADAPRKELWERRLSLLEKKKAQAR